MTTKMFQPLSLIARVLLSMEWEFPYKPLNSNRRYIYLYEIIRQETRDGNMNPTPLVTNNDDLSQYVNSIRLL
jgi:hypothetical protein